MPPDPAVTMTGSDGELDDEPYDSAEDEDFTLDQAVDEDDAEVSSSDDETAAEPAAKRRKTKTETGDVAAGEDADLDSGDEAMIRKAKERKQKQKQKRGKKGGKKASDDEEEEDVDFDEEDEEGGAGGFVRTRAMKMRIQEERKPLAKIDGATVDVDALWAQMNAPGSELGLAPSHEANKQEAAPTNDTEMRDEESTTQPDATAQEKRTQSKFPDEMVKIRRKYKFAGEIITEEKVVPRDSAEARLFLSGGQDGEAITATEDDIATGKANNIVRLRRPLRKVSRFDPNPTGLIKKSWEKQPIPQAGQENARGPKINTVEKSRLDWAAYVDRAGITDELRVHSKAKEGFLGRMDFLDRVGANQEEERRNARLKGM